MENPLKICFSSFFNEHIPQLSLHPLFDIILLFLEELLYRLRDKILKIFLLLNDFGQALNNEIDIFIYFSFTISSQVSLFNDNIVLKIDIKLHVVSEELQLRFYVMLAK